MIAKVLIAIGFAAVVLADSPPRYAYNAPQSAESYGEASYEDAKYDFDWSVKDEYSGNDFGQQETRDGEHTEGSYYVQLPDGRLQKVTYYVNGDSGYVAEVSYEGEARYDSVESSESYKAPRPTYSAPRPSYSAPRPSYSAPQESAEDSDETYTTPRATYQRRQPSYTPPKSAYGTPSRK